MRSASCEITELSNPNSAERVRFSRGSMKCAGRFAAPSTTPATEPAVAPFESVSHPPATVSPTVEA